MIATRISGMRALGLVAIALASTGCFTSWATSQAMGAPQIWDEKIREEVVPLPGVQERLVVALPLVIEYAPAPGATAGAPTAAPTTASTGGAALPFALACSADQRGRDAVHRSAFRYGSRWKKQTAIMAILEGAAGATLLLAGDQSDPRNVLGGGFLALDALGTAAVFFIPRKEIYRTDERAVTTPLRSDCPDGLVLDVAGDSFPVDAAGRIGEVGEAALADHMQAPRGPLLVHFAGQTVELRITPADQCAWQRAREPQQARCVATANQRVFTAIEVPVGTLTVIAAP